MKIPQRIFFFTALFILAAHTQNFAQVIEKRMWRGGRIDFGYTAFTKTSGNNDYLSDWSGNDINLGGTILYEIFSSTKISLELNIAIRQLFHDKEHASFRDTTSKESYETEQKFTQFMLNIPFLLHTNYYKFFFFEVGPAINLSLYGFYTEKISYNDENKTALTNYAHWPTNFFNTAVIVGTGAAFPCNSFEAGISLRFSYDFMPLEKGGSSELWAIKLALFYYQ